MAALYDQLDTIRELATTGNHTAIAHLLREMHAEDIAELINVIPSDLRELVFSLTDDEIKPDVLSELEDHAERGLVDSLSNDELADIVEDMAPDDAADVIAELSHERSREVLNLMEDEDSDDVRELLKYDEDTAGGIMTTEVIALPADITVGTAIERIAYMEDDEPFYNAYIISSDRTLIGYMGLWELIKTRDRTKKLDEICHKKMVSATTDMDQEEVAKIMSKYDLTAIPIVDAQHRLVGRVTIDDVIDVIEEEASEDIFRLAGSDDSELYYSSPLRACKVRLPWLLITLATGFVTSSILKHFMRDFNHVLALSFFVPVVTAMGGNAGIQSSTLIIRSIALGALEGRSFLKILGREIIAGALMGLCCGLIVGIWAEYLISTEGSGTAAFSPMFLAFTVGLALFAAMTFAVIFGALVLVALDKLNVDPAVASGPFVTSSNDIIALLIYYAVAITLILRAGGALS